MKLCPTCGYENADADAFCKYCGSSLSADLASAAQSDALPEIQFEPVRPANDFQAPAAPAYQEPQQPQQPAYEQPAYQQPAYQQPAYQQPAYQQPSYQSTVSSTSDFNAGTYALVFGILSMLCCGIIFGPLAIWKGKVAMDAFKANPDLQPASQKSMGTVGLILGIVGIVLTIVGSIFGLMMGIIGAAAGA